MNLSVLDCIVTPIQAGIKINFKVNVGTIDG